MNSTRVALLCALCLPFLSTAASAAEFLPLVNVTSTTQDSDIAVGDQVFFYRVTQP